jgi:hypothetical protein
MSLLEVMLAALVVGVSAIAVADVVRTGTATVEVTEVEVAARRLAADVLERYSGAPVGKDREVGDVTQILGGAPAAWEDLIADDPSLARGFPRDAIRRVLAQARVRVLREVVSPFTHPSLGPTAGLELHKVTVTWNDRFDRPRQVELARLVDRR